MRTKWKAQAEIYRQETFRWKEALKEEERKREALERGLRHILRLAADDPVHAAARNALLTACLCP